MRESAILLIDCPDRKGLVAAIANFLLAHQANILHADQQWYNSAEDSPSWGDFETPGDLLPVRFDAVAVFEHGYPDAVETRRGRHAPEPGLIGIGLDGGARGGVRESAAAGGPRSRGPLRILRGCRLHAFAPGA